MIVIGGATATGKSDIAIKVARELNGEIISADSMQIYKYMNIGTAKATESEMMGIPHHMIDIIEPNEEYSVAAFSDEAKKIASEIEKRGRVPILAGGTGLYINSLIYDYEPCMRDDNLRNELVNQYERYGADYIYAKLSELDPAGAANIHKNNIKRVIRALEVKILTGKSITEKHDKDKTPEYPVFIIDLPRENLYEKINARVEKMFEMGLKEEIDELINTRKVNFSSQSMQAIGYKEFIDYYNGYIELNDVKELIKQHTRNYAKRQITWFKSINNAIWLSDGDNELKAMKIVDYFNNNRGQIEND